MAEMRNKSMNRENGAIPDLEAWPARRYPWPLAPWVALTLTGHTAKEPARFWRFAAAGRAIRSDT